MTPNFPITPFLTEICDKLKASASHALVLTAETGAGKSTVLPLALLQAFDGKILMTEPRRLSVLGVANRVSSLLEESCGKTVGYQVHLEKKFSDATRLEVLTEAILVRKLQEDPALEDYNVVILDEFHERSIQLDLALAFLKEAMELRDDLFVIIMSATIDCEKIAQFMSEGFDSAETPVLKIPGKTFPVDIVYEEKSEISRVIYKETAKFLNQKEPQTLLAFLPGIGEIRKCVANLKEIFEQDSDFENVEVMMLHSSVSLEEQRKVLKPSEKGNHRVIVSSAIAETSLTIPGVSVVVDAGTARVNRLNITTGMEQLCTEKESEFSAAQRTGRAGREKPGKCIRLWNQFDLRQKNQEPEILRSDLVPLVLECADRGIYDLDKIKWLDCPNSAGWKTSRELLENLGCVNGDGRITPKGKATLGLGVHPRLGCVLLAGASPDLILKYTNYSNSSSDIQKHFIADLQRRVESAANFLEKNGIAGGQDYGRQNAKTDFSQTSNKLSDAEYLLEGFPDRLAKLVSENGAEQAEYQFAFGRKAILGNSNKAISQVPKWIIAPEVVTGNKSIIYEFDEISEEKVMNFVKNKVKIVLNCKFHEGKIKKTEEIRFGQIVISSKNIQSSAEDFASAWVNEVQNKGLEVLPLDEKTERLLVRWEFINQQKATENSSYFSSEEQIGRQNLANQANEWLPAFLSGSTKITSQIVYDALYWFINGSEIDEKAPEQILLPTGRRCKVHYEKLASPDDKNKLVIRPVIEIIIQRIFGCFETPKICGMKVLLRLLSPASRPLQITDDLENFWTGAWPEICKEMKGRYPKHNWEYTVVEKE